VNARQLMAEGDGKQPMGTATEKLVSAILPRQYEDIPPELTHEAKRLLLDFLGVGLAGSRSDSGRIAAAFAVDQTGPPQATILGRNEQADAINTAFANAIASHSVELDDIDEEALFHHGPPIVSTALATAELTGASGKALLTAIVGGCETITRISKATNPELRNRGYHTTPACGVFGAAVTAGILLQITEEQLVSALGLAGAQASGLMEMYGPSMQKRFNPGPAARNGLTSALMARAGFTGANTILDGERGFAAAFAGLFHEDRFLDGLGRTIPVILEYKPYSCARPIHNAIDAALALRERGLTADDIAQITVYRHPMWAHYHQIAHPRTFHEAQMSLPYSVALALVVGEALPRQYAKVGRGDDLTMRLSEMVVVEADSRLSRGVSCRIVAHMKAGDTAESVVDHPLGSTERPLSDTQLVSKFTSLAVETIGADRAADVVEQVWRIDDAPTVAKMTALLKPEALPQHAGGGR
jgi:2-methylcitrate dehydratase PrpD